MLKNKTIKESESLVLNLMFNDESATDAILKYCNRFNLNIPFSFVYNKKMYSRTKDLYELKIRNFVQLRSYHRRFFISIGSLHIKDDSLRKDICSDSRLLISWLHNPRSVAVLMLSHNKNFNEYIGTDIKKLSQLSDLYKEQSTKLLASVN